MALLWSVTVQTYLYSCSLLQVAHSWAPHGMAAQPYMAATHMQIFLTSTGPWDVGGSVRYAGTEIYPHTIMLAWVRDYVPGIYITSILVTQYIFVYHAVTMQSQCTTGRQANIQLMVKLSQDQIRQASTAEKRYK